MNVSNETLPDRLLLFSSSEWVLPIRKYFPYFAQKTTSPRVIFPLRGISRLLSHHLKHNIPPPDQFYRFKTP
jgi:hypothetical protein